MSTRTGARTFAAILCLGLFPASAFLTGCKDDTSTQVPPLPALRIGSRPFAFDDKAVSELWISKDDAATGDHWTARLRAASPEKWEVASGPGDAPLVDRLADAGFIQHLLSTLQTLEIAEIGLTHPVSARYVLRWTLPDGPRELVLGQDLTPDGATYARLPGLTTETVGVRGSTLGMLGHLKNFEVLRHRRLATWSADDVWAFDIFQGPRRTFTAQRQSGEWADDSNRIYVGQVQEWLDRVLHLMVLRFNDNAEESTRLHARMVETPTYRVIFRNRRDSPRVLAVGLERGAWWGIEDSRPGAVFRMPSDVAGYLLPPKVKLKRVPLPKARRSP